MDYFEKNKMPVGGVLTDRRDDGCGYDFEIKDKNDLYFIEVKGLASENGGILFTDKEWSTAIKKGDKYYLILVKNISNEPIIKIIQNPASTLKVKKNIYTTIQIDWCISAKALNQL